MGDVRIPPTTRMRRRCQTFGRPVGVAVAGDGALLVGDDTNGLIYRVAFGAR